MIGGVHDDSGAKTLPETAPGVAQWSGGGLTSVAACPACGASARVGEPLVARDVLGRGGEDQWRLHLCAQCGSIYLDPRPDDASIAETYRSYYTHATASSATGSSNGRMRALAMAVVTDYLAVEFGQSTGRRAAGGRWLCRAFPPLRFKLDYHGRHLFRQRFPAGSRLLDVGCGNGQFLAVAQTMGWRAMGVDPDVSAVAACQAAGLDAVLGDAETVGAAADASFDAVTLSHCLEHVVSPQRVMAACLHLLKPGGMIWIAVPNPGGLGRRLFGRAWRGLEPSRHLCVPSAGQLMAMAKDAGFERVRLLRRGEHGKTITRESGLIARADADPRIRWRAGLAMPLRFAASVLGSISPRWGEEIVMVAFRPVG